MTSSNSFERKPSKALPPLPVKQLGRSLARKPIRSPGHWRNRPCPRPRRSADSGVSELRSELDQRIRGVLEGPELGERVEQAVRAALENASLDRQEIVDQAREEAVAAARQEVSDVAASVQEGVDTSAIDEARAEARKALGAAKTVLLVSVLVFVAAAGGMFLL